LYIQNVLDYFILTYCWLGVGATPMFFLVFGQFYWCFKEKFGTGCFSFNWKNSSAWWRNSTFGLVTLFFFQI